MTNEKATKTRSSQKTHLIWLGLLLLTCAAAWLLLRSQTQKKSIRNVLLISIDTCRPDYLSCYGFHSKTTPTIDAIAKQAIVFTNAFTPVPLTLPAHSSMLSGTYPPSHGVHDNLDYIFAESNLTIAEILRQHHFATGAIIGAFVLDQQFGLAQGFDTYNGHFEQPAGSGDSLERPAAEVSRLACNYLDQHRDEPFFLFLHYFDPHSEYEPPEPFASQYANNLYAGEIAYTDHCIAQVVQKLKTLRLYDSTLIVIVGDHGEALSDHGEAEHGYYIYQSTVKVPFIIRPPGQRKTKYIESIVSLVDVVPTILGYLNIDAPAHLQGKDLSVHSATKTPVDMERYLYCESLVPTKYDCNPLFGLVDKQYKYIETTRPELYNLLRDPLEQENLINKEPEHARLMKNQLYEMIEQLTNAISPDGTADLDDQTRERLETLGYVGTAPVTADLQIDQTKPDPKDFISLHEYTSEITRLIYQDRLDQTETVCEKMLADWPKMPETHFQLARISFKKGQLTKSITHNHQYLALIGDPDTKHTENLPLHLRKNIFAAQRMLGSAHHNLAHYDQAVQHYKAALNIRPDRPDLHNNIAVDYFNLGNLEKAIFHWTQALHLAPARPDVHDNLAIAFYHQGKIDKAIAHWTEALRLKPDWTEVREKLNNLTRQRNQSSDKQ
jgi:arylsulfatase A-like enzyme